MRDFLTNAAITLTRRNPTSLQLSRDASLRLVATITTCIASAMPLNAAEVKTGFAFDVVLEGNIETGDCEKLRNFIKEGDKTEAIYLASPGGNVAEAIKIGRLVRALNLEMIIPGQVVIEFRSRDSSELLERIAVRNHIKNRKDNYMCASACFFIFIAGVHRIKDIWPSLEEPVLGIHRPFLTENDLRVGLEMISFSINSLRCVG